MEKLKTILHTQQCSCVIAKQGEIRIFNKPGVLDLYQLITNEPEFLSNAFIADKIVGKGAATLMVYGKIQHLYAEIISKPALNLLQENNVLCSYGQLVDYIQNKTKTDWCPLEKKCQTANTINELFVIVNEFVESVKR